MGKNFKHQLSKNGVLNEHNLQACFQFNATTGEYVYANAKGTVLIDVDSPRVRQQVRSDKICIDMGYSIDGDPRKDWKFILGSTVLIIQTVALRGDLTKINLALNECAVVTNDPNFRTCLWLDYKADGKTLHYDFTTLNTSVSAWMMDEIGRKLNSYDPSALDVRITETENRVTSVEEKITAVESNITELQGKVTTNENKIEDLEDKTIGFTRSADISNTTFTDNVVILSNSNLSVTGNGIINGALGVNGLSSLQDMQVTGNVRGVLKDSQGFKYEKVKRGTIANGNGFENLRLKLNSNGEAKITGTYTEYDGDNIDSLGIVTKTKINPNAVTNLKTIQFINKDTNFVYLVSGVKNTSTNLKIIYRNISDATASINGLSFDVIINCEINVNSSSITWD